MLLITTADCFVSTTVKALNFAWDLFCEFRE